MFLSFFGQFGGPIFGGTWWNPRLKKKMVSGQLGAITLGTGFLLRALNIPFSMKSKWFPYYVRGSWPFMTFLNLFGDDNSHVLLQLTHCLGPRITETKRQCNKRVTIESKGNKHKDALYLSKFPFLLRDCWFPIMPFPSNTQSGRHNPWDVIQGVLK